LLGPSLSWQVQTHSGKRLRNYGIKKNLL